MRYWIMWGLCVAVETQYACCPTYETAQFGQVPMIEEWSSIVAHYAEVPTSDVSINGVATLARHIAETPLSSGLFGWTSMFDLCITQTRVTYPFSGSYLRVRPFPIGIVEFRYIDTQIEAQQWKRTVPASETVARLRVFLGQLNWFVESGSGGTPCPPKGGIPTTRA